MNGNRAPRVAVIMLTLNQRDRTLDCLATLVDQGGAGFDTLVWDNGSEDGTVAAIAAAYPQVVAHFHPTNLGVASGRNAAARLAEQLFKPAYFMFLDNDMRLEPGFVASLLEPLLEDDHIGQTQAKLRFMDRPDRLNDGGGAQIDFLRWQITPVGYGEIDLGQHDARKNCIACGGAMMVRAELFRRLGGFDPAFDPFGPEDLDFSLRLQRTGYRALFVPQAVAYHMVSHTYGRDYSEQYARYKIRHWLTFMSRHASIPQKIGFFLLGAPWLAIQVVIREGRRGNFRAILGFIRGLVDSVKPSADT